jgi:hypothetical protein
VVVAGGVMPSASFKKASEAAMKPRRSETLKITRVALSVGAPLLAHNVIVGVHVAIKRAKNIRIACCLSVRPIFNVIVSLEQKKRGFKDLWFVLA